MRIADEAQPFAFGGARPVGRFGRGSKPALIDSTPLAAKCVQVVGMESQPPSRNHEGARNPARLQSEDSFRCTDSIPNLRSIEHCFHLSFSPFAHTNPHGAQ